MNKSNNTGIFLHTAILLFLSTLFLSCDTEYNDKVNEIPGDVIKVPGYTQIESFTVNDTENNSISAAITDENIIITWSSFMAFPETIKPEIVLGTEAAISPASGTTVPFKDGTVYTVTSKAGTTKKYTLKIDFRQKEPRAWNTPGSETLGKGFLQNITNMGGSNTNVINDLWLSAKDTRVYFVAAADQKEYTAEVVYVGNGEGTTPFNNYGIYYFIPEDMPLGLYDLRVKNGAYLLQNASVENRFKVEIAEPDYFNAVRYGFPAEKQVGETIEVRGGLMNEILSVELYNTSNTALVYPLEIVSLTKYRAVLKIPVGVPAGIYNRMRFKREEGTSNSSLVVTVK